MDDSGKSRDDQWLDKKSRTFAGAMRDAGRDDPAGLPWSGGILGDDAGSKQSDEDAVTGEVEPSPDRSRCLVCSCLLIMTAITWSMLLTLCSPVAPILNHGRIYCADLIAGQVHIEADTTFDELYIVNSATKLHGKSPFKQADFTVGTAGQARLNDSPVQIVWQARFDHRPLEDHRYADEHYSLVELAAAEMIIWKLDTRDLTGKQVEQLRHSPSYAVVVNNSTDVLYREIDTTGTD